MASAAKIRASRLNGAKSRGPITEQGKKKSSLNALKHGLTAKTLVLSNEDHSIFEKLQQTYIDSFQPTNSLELELIHTMAAAEWRMRRAWTVETALADTHTLLHRRKDEAENPELAPKRVANHLTPMQLRPEAPTGRNPTDYFFSGTEPKPAAGANSQSPSHQQLAAPEEIPPQSEPKK